ncbi:MAG TPA: hypothetical protein VHT68_16685 [Pseudolabrys sp.]|jgi:hypothetical protein|nr:hypothetical protein [Pseudolabrys sp.]
MKKKNKLHYELYGSSAGAGQKGYWRWAIFAGREKKPVLVGSFCGELPDAKKHADAAIARLKERARKQKPLPTK